MRLFGVTRSAAHPRRRRHVQRGAPCAAEGRAHRAPRGAQPQRVPLALPHHRWQHPDQPRGWPCCLPLCALALGKGYPTSAPPNPIGAIHQHCHLAPAEQKGKATKQNPRHKRKGDCRAPARGHREGVSRSVSQRRRPRRKAQAPMCYSSDCEREMRGPLRISFRFSSFFLRFSSSRSAFWKVSALGKNSEWSVLKGLR